MGGFLMRGLASKGRWRAEMVEERVEGIEKGACWGGMDGGNGGREVGVGRTFRGASRRGSTDLR